MFRSVRKCHTVFQSTSTLKIVCLWPLVSQEKFGVILIRNVKSLFLASFKIFFFAFRFQEIMMYLAVDFLNLFCLGIFLLSGYIDFYLLPNMEFPAIISSNSIFSPIPSTSLFGTWMTQMLDILSPSHRYWRLFIFLKNHFLSAVQNG